MTSGGRRHSGLSGVLVVDKPAGPTSFHVVQRIRKITGVKKVGHAGTLDPMATGVLTVCLGRATKLVPFIQNGPKVYLGRMVLGMTTDTDDITGQVTAKRLNVRLNPEDIVNTAHEFIGRIEQVPPAYSAVKFGGRPAYRLARRGEKVSLKSREVVIHELVLTEIQPPLVTFRVRVSKGTYIRSLVADMGRRLNIGACLESLRRLASEPFTLDKALTLAEVEALAEAGELADHVITPDQALSFFMPEVRVTGELKRTVENGRPLPLSSLDDFEPQPGPVRIRTADENLLAVYEYNPPDRIRAFECLTPVRILGRD